VLTVLQPAASELHVAAAADIERQRQLLHKTWHQRLERARYEVERACRQYQQVEPENRLVARQLEAGWEQALRQQARLQEEHERFCQDQPVKLSAQQMEQIRQLASDVPRLWCAETTTVQDRQRLVRLLVQKVQV